jgi:hypothetical protein
MLRFTAADRGRKASLTVDGVQLAEVAIPASGQRPARGFFQVEYPIPARLLVDAQGHPKEKFVVRLTASASTLMPGLYYVRLVRGQGAAAPGKVGSL